MKNSLEKKFGSLPFLRVSKPFIRKYGIDVACVIAELIYWSRYMCDKTSVKTNNGYFFYEMHKLQLATGITPYRQRKAMEQLIKIGVLKIKDEKMGIPPKRFYKVDEIAYKILTTQAYNEFQSSNGSGNIVDFPYKKDRDGKWINIEDDLDDDLYPEGFDF